MRALHSRKDVTSMLNQFVQVSILPALLVLFLEEHLQCMDWLVSASCLYGDWIVG